jgi:preprotein translocase subunit SecG
LDPLDPLTEIINSGQGYSPAIALERIIWAMIGVFFLGAILKSITNSMRSQNRFGRKSLFSYSKDKKITDNTSSQFSGDDEKGI